MATPNSIFLDDFYFLPPFFKALKSSMNRRARYHDYYEPCIYMITMLSNPAIGKLSEIKMDYWGRVLAIKNEKGLCIDGARSRLLETYKTLDIYNMVVMPDHIHMILRVLERTNFNLGNYLGAFKSFATQELAHIIAPDSYGKKISFFRPEFNDSICTTEGQLGKMKRYINDNPRRLYVKRQHKDYFSFHEIESIDGIQSRYIAYGNIDLLEHWNKKAIRISRRTTDMEMSGIQNRMVDAFRNGCVLVSPFISPGEKLIYRNYMEAGGKAIKIIPEGFSERYKPIGKEFELCSQGQLLIIGSCDYNAYSYTMNKQLAERLNSTAAQIANSNDIRYHRK